jgi:hypothetical protein
MGHLAHTHIFILPPRPIKNNETRARSHIFVSHTIALIFYDSLQKLHAASSKVGDAGRASRVGGWVMMVT